MLFSFIVSIFGLLFLLINTILFWSTSKNKNFKYKLITVYLTIIFVVELVCNYIGYNYPNSNFYLSHYYFNIQFILLSIFFFSLFNSKFIKNSILAIAAVVFLTLTYQYASNPDLYFQFNILEIALTFLSLILYGTLFLVKNLKSVHLYFYFTLGLLFYLSSSSAIFLSGNTEYVIFKEPFFFDIWVFNSLFFILYQFLIFKEWKLLNGKLKQEKV